MRAAPRAGSWGRQALKHKVRPGSGHQDFLFMHGLQRRWSKGKPRAWPLPWP